MKCVSSHRLLGSLVVRKKEFRLKRFISLEDINLSRQNQNFHFYILNKSWNFSVKHVIYTILTHFAYRANGNKLWYIGQWFTAKVCDSWRHWKMTSFMALDGVTSFLRLKDVTISCKRMRLSLIIGGSSSVRWRKVGRRWILRMCFRRLLCVRIEIDQLQCVNCWVIIDCLSVSCTKMNYSRCACDLIFFTTDLQTVNYYSTIHCWSWSIS